MIYKYKTMEYSRRLIPYFFVLTLGVMTIFARYKYNGLIYGFDYGLYQPDGMHYTFRALDLLNHNPEQSAQQVSDWYKSNSFKTKNISIADLIPETSPVYSYISHRILYPLLSVPFVYMFGIPGMLVVPSIAFLVLLFVVLRICSSYKLMYIGVTICLVLSISPTVTRWMVSNTTDALLVGLFSYSIILLKDFSFHSKTTYIQIPTLIALTSATRFSLVFWVAIGLVLFLNREKLLSICIIFIASICSIPALKASLGVALLPNSKEQTTFEKIFSLPVSFCKVLFVDVAQLAVLDRALLAFLLFGVFLALLQFKSIVNQYFLAMLFAGYILGAVNGVLGVNFRYQLPVIPFCAWTIVSSINLVKSKPNLFSFLQSHIKT